MIFEMENKSNKSTALRPKDDRLLKTYLVEIDLNKFIAQLKQETTGWKVNIAALLFLNKTCCPLCLSDCKQMLND